MNVSRKPDQKLSPHFVFSIVSHGQLQLIKNLLLDLRRLSFQNISIVLTINIPEDEKCLVDFSDLPIIIVRNESSKGFGENHNQAFERCDCDVFFVVNPDIRIQDFSFEPFLKELERPEIGAVAPLVLSPGGVREDSVRRFPTLARLLKRVLLRQRGLDYQFGSTPIEVEWSAGMFVAFRKQAFEQVRGFDTNFFMYMEDADICRRLKKNGWSTVLQPEISVIHDAQRASRRSFRHMRWHIFSAMRFLFFPIRRY